MRTVPPTTFGTVLVVLCAATFSVACGSSVDKSSNAKTPTSTGTAAKPSGSLVVAAKSGYNVYDVSGAKLIGTNTSSEPLTLPAGDYVVQVNGLKQPVTIHDGEQATLSIGTVLVMGAGADRYYVWDSTEKQSLAGQMTNMPVELFAGNYMIELNGSKHAATVTMGQQTDLPTGSLIISAAQTDRYYIYDTSGSQLLIGLQTNQALELFPGNYQVDLGGPKRPFTVVAGQRTEVPK